MLDYLVRYYYDFRRHFAMNLVEEDDIRSLVWVGKTHGEIASWLPAQFSTVQRGFSERNVRELLPCARDTKAQGSGVRHDRTVMVLLFNFTLSVFSQFLIELVCTP